MEAILRSVLPSQSEYGGVETWLRALRLGGNETLDKPYLENAWVYACVNAFAKNFSACPLGVYTGPEDDADAVESGPLVDLLRNPNPQFGGTEMLYAAGIAQQLTGENFFRARGPAGDFDIETGVPPSLWLFPGDRVQLYTTDIDRDSGEINQWHFDTLDGSEAVSPNSVVQIRRHDPYSPGGYRGTSPMQAYQRAAAKDYALDRLDEALARHGGCPTIGLKSAHPLTSKMVEEVNQQFKRLSESSNGSLPWLFPNGIEAQKLGFSPKEMELGDLRQWNLTLAIAIFGVTKPILGITDDVNRANAREAVRVFWDEHVIPQQDAFARQLEHGLLRRLPGVESTYSLRWDRSCVEALADDLDEKIDRFTKLLDAGVKPGKAAAVAGFSEDELGEADMEPPAPVPDFTPGGPQPDEEPEAPEDEPRSVPTKVSREIRDPMEDPEARREEVRAFNEGLVPHDKTLAEIVEKQHELYLRSVEERINETARAAKLLARDGEVRKTTLPQGTMDAIQVREFTDEEIASLLPSTAEFKEALGELGEDAMRALMFEAAAGLAATLGADSLVLTSNAEVFLFLSQKKVLLANTVDTVRDRIRSVIIQTLAGQPNTVTLADAIQNELTALKDKLGEVRMSLPARAMAIARTETTAAANGGRMAEMQAQGIRQHRWLDAGDNHVRTSHQELDNKIADVGQAFAFGLRFPGDPQASPDQTVNCRCTTVPVASGDDDDA